MAFPAGVQTVTVTAPANGYRTLDGEYQTGTITLTPSVREVVSAQHGIIAVGEVNFTVGASGSFPSRAILPNDAEGFVPVGWTYRLDQQLTGETPRSYNVFIPASAGSVDLSSLVEVQASDGTTVSVPGGHGTPSDTVTTETSFGQAASAGASTDYARGDHTHGTPAAPVVGTTAGTYAAGDDARLSNARTPTAHASSHGSAGSDPVTVAQSQVTGLTAALAGKTAGPATSTDNAIARYDGTTGLQLQDSGVTIADDGATTVGGNLTVEGYTTLQGGQFNGDFASFGDLQLIGTGKAYRMRRGGTALDFEGGGADMILSVWSGGDFTGTQHSYARFSSDTQNVQIAGKVEVVDALYGAVKHTLDPAAGATITGDLSVTGKVTTGGVALPLMVPSSPRPAYRPASWSQQFQAGHGWSTSGSGVASSGDDTATFCKGVQSYRVTTTGTGAVANIRRLASALPDLTGKAIRLTFRVSDVTHLNQINVQVGTSSLANTLAWRLHTHAASAENQVLSGEWATATLAWADIRSATGTYSISSTGVPSSTSGFTDFLFQVVDDNSGNPITVNLQAVEIIPDTTETFPGGVVSITFDDSYVTQFTGARPKMDALNFRGTLYTICDVIGPTPGTYLSLSQLQSVQNNSGWEIAGHAYSVVNHNAKYNTLTAATVEDDVRKTRMWMTANGFPSDSFAYPGGWFSKTSDSQSIEALTCKYFSSGRGISSADTLETFPPAMPFRMRSITGIGSLAGGSARGLPANLVGNGGALDRCQLNGDWTILTFHEVVAGTAANANQCSQADFDLIMDAIAARQIPVLPVGDILRLYS